MQPRKFHGQRSLVGYSPWGRKESDTTEKLGTHTAHSLHILPAQTSNSDRDESLGPSQVFYENPFSSGNACDLLIPRNGSELFKVFFGYLILQHFILSFWLSTVCYHSYPPPQTAIILSHCWCLFSNICPRGKGGLHLVSSELDQILKSLVSEFFRGTTRHVKK